MSKQEYSGIKGTNYSSLEIQQQHNPLAREDRLFPRNDLTFHFSQNRFIPIIFGIILIDKIYVSQSVGY